MEIKRENCLKPKRRERQMPPNKNGTSEARFYAFIGVKTIAKSGLGKLKSVLTKVFNIRFFDEIDRKNKLK